MLLQSGAVGCEKGFATCFLKVPLACLGSMAAAAQPNCLWNSQKTCHKTFSSTCRPRLYMWWVSRLGQRYIWMMGLIWIKNKAQPRLCPAQCRSGLYDPGFCLELCWIMIPVPRQFSEIYIWNRNGKQNDRKTGLTEACPIDPIPS